MLWWPTDFFQMLITFMNVLILCTGNSARSILAEALFNAMGRGRVQAYSAGSAPTGKVNPLALEVLAMEGIPTEGLSSKSWDVFSGAGAPAMELIITVCDNAAGEACPIWPGAPLRAHWGLPDPAAVEGDETTRLKAFLDTAQALRARIAALLELGDEVFADHVVLQQHLDSIGRMREGAV